MQKMLLVGLGMAFSLSVAAASKPRVPGQSERTFRQECSAYSQAGMRDCLAQKARSSEQALKEAEKIVTAVLSKWDEDEKYVALAKTRFDASRKAFAEYRQAQCVFAASLAGGAIGGARDMGRLACLAELNGRRAEQLRNAVADLPPK